MVTIKEIAHECGVSATTISNVLNGKAKTSEETRKRILEVIAKRGYRPNSIAQGLRSQRTKTIGIIAEDIALFSSPEIIEGIMAFCEKKGYRVVVKNLRMYSRWSDSWYNDETAYHSIMDPALQELLSIMVDGIIYVAGHARYITSFPEDFATPAVMAYAYSANEDIPSVLLDDEDTAYRIVKYLTEKGHKNIAILAGLPDNIHTQRRLLGAQKALFEAGILFNPDWVRFVNWDLEPAYKAAGEMLGTGATAIFCMTDRMAGGIYRYVDEKGMRVGKDISIVGYDDQDMSEYMLPPLTTARLPLVEIGNCAARLLFSQIEGGGEEPDFEETVEDAGKYRVKKKGNKEYMIPCDFIERESVKDLCG